ncbi:asparagine synthase [Gracilaria domingensis]|nr:asparagine synthase [Gracilaria domingensis]
MVVDLTVGDGPDSVVGDMHGLRSVLRVVNLKTGEAECGPAVFADESLQVVWTTVLQFVGGGDGELHELVAGQGATENGEDSAHGVEERAATELGGGWGGSGAGTGQGGAVEAGAAGKQVLGQRGRKEARRRSSSGGAGAPGICRAREQNAVAETRRRLARLCGGAERSRKDRRRERCAVVPAPAAKKQFPHGTRASRPLISPRGRPRAAARRATCFMPSP